MDISFWTQCNPNIRVEHTTKKFFGRYLYKMVVFAPGGRAIDSKRGIAADVQHRIDIQKDTVKTSWWWYRNPNLDQANIEQLEQLNCIKANRKSLNILVRIEEPYVQIYSESLEQLQNIVDQYLGNFKSSVNAIAYPEDHVVDALNSGAIIRKKDIGYRYKVTLRDGRYDTDNKVAVLNYLTELDESVAKLPTSCYMMLAKNYGYIWNCYFYTNDPSVTSFLSLIVPGMVLNIHELVIEADK